MKRLLGYVRPYQFWMVLGIMALAVVALAEGTIAFLIVPIIDRVLTPSASDSNLSLFKLPAGGPLIFLNQFSPHEFRSFGRWCPFPCWSCFSSRELRNS